MEAQDKPATIPAQLGFTVERFGSRIAIEDGDQRITYAELQARSRRVSRALIALGVQSGDRVAIWASNVHEWITAALGIYSAGAVLVPVSTRMKGAEVADILERSRARVLFSIGDFLGSYYPDMLEGYELPDLAHRIVLRSPRAEHFGWERFLELASSVDDAAVQIRVGGLSGDSISDLMFTSGTTGRPKGVLTSHGQNLRAFDCWSGVLGMRETDRYLIVNPFFHTAGYKAGWLATIIRGATILPEALFDAELVLKRLSVDQISFILGPPTLFLTLLNSPKRHDYDLSSLRVAVTGAATVPPVLIERMRNELGFRTVVTAYGLTESCGFATICDPTDDAETIANTCGKAIPDVEIRCVDAEGGDVPSGLAGEVLIRGYNVMKGYFEDERATRETIDEDGWLHTGDVGVLDERGYLRITDRLKDMFIVGGFNCYPAEIERLAAAHPGVAQIAVIGVADDRMGEVGKAFVIRREGTSLEADEFIAWCKRNMTNYKVPRYVEFVDSLPTNAGGKVLKRELQGRATT